MKILKILKNVSLLIVSGLMLAPVTYAGENDVPIAGTWYNSYCSQVKLSVQDSGLITGVYTSHTGSTGSSNVLGYVNLDAGVDNTGDATMGIPFALGVNWRLINVDVEKADGSWHWTSTFSGQYHPAQTIAVPGQKSYEIPETLEILNGLIATATTPFNETSPVMWPQTLRFHRDAPEYCESVSPPSPVPYTPTAADYISGNWYELSGPGHMILSADLESGQVSGTAVLNGIEYAVSGLFDTIAPPSSTAYMVTHQSVTLALARKDEFGIKMLSGGADIRIGELLFAWSSDQVSTTWVDRFTQEPLDKIYFFRGD